MQKITNLMDRITTNKNKIFLFVCMVIHIIYLFIFNSLQIWIMAFLNLISSTFYFNYLFIKKDVSEHSIAASYFEILIFAFLSELAMGPDYGFVLYMIGMTAAILYLLPAYGNKRFGFQVIGILSTFLLEMLVVGAGISFPNIQEPAAPYAKIFYMANIFIMDLILFAATLLYSRESEKTKEILSDNMNHDVLTGLYNRRFFERQMEQIPDQERCQYVISMMDIDDLKKVNDTYGHEAGDDVLVQVAACLAETAGKENLAIRWGGEEFILYFPKATPDQVRPVMEQLRKKIEQTVVKTAGKEIHVTITTGIATGLPDSNYEMTIRSADEKLYLGKNRGKNCVIV